MKITKKIALLVVIFMLSTTFSTYAADDASSAEITLNPSSTSAKVGETVTITLSGKTAAGLESVMSTLKYDKSKLELTNPGQLATAEYLSMSDVDDGTGLFMISVMYVGSGNAPVEANFATLTFKVLDAATANEELSVKLSECEVGDSNDEWFEVEDKEIVLTVVESTTPEDPTPEDPTPEDPTPEDPTPEDPTPEDPTPENPTPEKPKDNTTADKPMNNAGLETYGIIAIIATILVAVVLYAKCKNLSDVK